MVFSSSVFLCAFLPTVIVLYYLFHDLTYRNTLLFLVSLFFYAWGEPRNLILLLCSVVINFLLARGIDRRRGEGTGGGKAFMIAAVILNCGVLFVYKYLGFAVDNINAVLRFFGSASDSLTRIALTLPIGISFFTFQAMSYVIDVYRGTAPAQSNMVNFGLYLTFFPQLIAGPIVRYSTVAQQIGTRSTEFDDFAEGTRRFILGLAKKVLIANTVAVIADNAFETVSYMPLGFSAAWYGAICYTLQIYFDFSGYSDMALGLGRMFGFRFPENFNYPYFASTITDFWRRWHISLSSWFRDYVYIPLGGSRVKKSRLIFNLLVVWLLTGIWHGANWTFICWGLLYFVLLSGEKLGGLDKRLASRPFLSLLYRAFTLIVVIVCWVIFRSDNLHMALDFIRCMFLPNREYALSGIRYFSLHYFAAVAFFAFLSLPFAGNLWRRLKAHLPALPAAVIEDCFFLALALLSLANIVSSTYNPFIYFNF